MGPVPRSPVLPLHSATYILDKDLVTRGAACWLWDESLTRRNLTVTCVVTENKPMGDEQTRPQVSQIYETEVAASTASRRTSSLGYINSCSSSYVYVGRSYSKSQ